MGRNMRRDVAYGKEQAASKDGAGGSGSGGVLPPGDFHNYGSVPIRPGLVYWIVSVMF